MLYVPVTAAPPFEPVNLAEKFCPGNSTALKAVIVTVELLKVSVTLSSSNTPSKVSLDWVIDVPAAGFKASSLVMNVSKSVEAVSGVGVLEEPD